MHMITCLSQMIRSAGRSRRAGAHSLARRISSLPGDHMKKHTLGRWTAAVAAALLVTTASACGTSGSGGTDAKASGAGLAKYQSTLNAWYKGTYKEPAGP